MVPEPCRGQVIVASLQRTSFAAGNAEQYVSPATIVSIAIGRSSTASYLRTIVGEQDARTLFSGHARAKFHVRLPQDGKTRTQRQKVCAPGD